MLLIFNQQGVHCSSYFIPGTQVVVIPTLFLQSSRHLQQYTTSHLRNTLVGKNSLIFNLTEYLSWFLWIDGNCIWDITELPGRMIRKGDFFLNFVAFLLRCFLFEKAPRIIAAVFVLWSMKNGRNIFSMKTRSDYFETIALPWSIQYL